MSKNLVMQRLASAFDKDREMELEAAELLSLEVNQACEIALSTLREVKTLLQDAGTG